MRAAEGWEPRPASSTEYVWSTITAENADGLAVAPNSTPGYALLQLEATLTSPDANDVGFKIGTWRTVTVDRYGNTLDEPEYELGVLVGAGGVITPVAGRYVAFVKLAGAPEVPIRQVLNDRGAPEVLILT